MSALQLQIPCALVDLLWWLPRIPTNMAERSQKYSTPGQATVLATVTGHIAAGPCWQYEGAAIHVKLMVNLCYCR